MDQTSNFASGEADSVNPSLQDAAKAEFWAGSCLSLRVDALERIAARILACKPAPAVESAYIEFGRQSGAGCKKPVMFCQA